MNFVQCKLKNSCRTHVAWLPEKFAQVGKCLQLKFGNSWENHWQVVETWAERPREVVLNKERDYSKQRKASDR